MLKITKNDSNLFCWQTLQIGQKQSKIPAMLEITKKHSTASFLTSLQKGEKP
jgi:hypothetical protein